jgi:hypothetical protein
MERRDFLKGAGAVLAGTALAGCEDNTSGKENVDEDTKYRNTGFVEAEADLTAYDHVRMEGHLQYQDRVNWQDGDIDAFLRTYELYEEDPQDAADPESLFSVTVVEYEDEIVDSVPEEPLMRGTPQHIEISGATDRMMRDPPGDKEDEYNRVLKAHDAKPIE